MHRVKIAGIMLLALYVLIALVPEYAHAQSVASGYQNTRQVYLLLNEKGEVEGMSPSELQVYYFAVVADFASYIADEESCTIYPTINWEWASNEPDGYAYVDGVLFYVSNIVQLSSDAKLGFNGTYNISNITYTQYKYGASIYLVVTVYLDAVSITGRPAVLDLGEAIRSVVGGDPVVHVYGHVKIVCGDETKVDRDIDKYITLSTSNLRVSVVYLEYNVKQFGLESYTITGNLTSEGVTFHPTYSMTVCLRMPNTPYPIDTVVTVLDKEKTVTVGEEWNCTTVGGLTLPSYTNISIPIILRSGLFTIVTYYNVTPEGGALYVGRPVAIIERAQTVDRIRVIFPVALVGTESTYATVSGAVTYVHSIACNPVSLTGTGYDAVVCEDLVEHGQRSRFISYTLYLTLNGKQAVLQGELEPLVVESTQLSETLITIYIYMINISMGAAIVGLVLAMIDYILSTFTRFSLGIISRLNVIISLIVVALTLELLIPSAVNLVGYLLHKSPEIGEYINYLPITESGNPFSYGTQVFRFYLSYYDKLFDEIMANFDTYVVANINAIITRMSHTTALALSILVIAIAVGFAKFIGGAMTNILVTIGGTILSVVMGVITLIIMTAPSAALVTAAVVLTRVFIYIVMAVSLGLFPIGVILTVLGGETLGRFGVQMVGAGLVFMFVMPALAPISYGLYKVAMKNVIPKIQQMPAPEIDIGPAHLFYPLRELATISAYLAIASMSLIIVISGLATILYRTGVFSGIGEAFMLLLWR